MTPELQKAIRESKSPWLCRCGGIVEYVYSYFWKCRRCNAWGKLMVDDITYLQTRFDAEMRGKLIDRLNMKLHKARTQIKVLKKAYGQLLADNNGLRDTHDKIRHDVAGVRLQMGKMIKRLEHIYAENKALKDRNFLLEAYYQATITGDGKGIWVRAD